MWGRLCLLLPLRPNTRTQKRRNTTPQCRLDVFDGVEDERCCDVSEHVEGNLDVLDIFHLLVRKSMTTPKSLMDALAVATSMSREKAKQLPMEIEEEGTCICHRMN